MDSADDDVALEPPGRAVKKRRTKSHSADFMFFTDVVAPPSGGDGHGLCVHCNSKVDMKADRRQRHLVVCSRFREFQGKSFIEWATDTGVSLHPNVLKLQGKVVAPSTPIVDSPLPSARSGTLAPKPTTAGPLDKHTISTRPLVDSEINRFQLAWTRYASLHPAASARFCLRVRAT